MLREAPDNLYPAHAHPVADASSQITLDFRVFKGFDYSRNPCEACVNYCSLCGCDYGIFSRYFPRKAREVPPFCPQGLPPHHKFNRLMERLILELAGSNGGVTVGEVCNWLNITQRRAVLLVGGLVRAGLLQKVRKIRGGEIVYATTRPNHLR